MSISSGCGILSTTRVIDTSCVSYEPVRNYYYEPSFNIQEIEKNIKAKSEIISEIKKYIEAHESAVPQIDLNNAVYLERCKDGL